jgi:hypothetical protein
MFAEEPHSIEVVLWEREKPAVADDVGTLAAEIIQRPNTYLPVAMEGPIFGRDRLFDNMSSYV